MVPGWRSSRTPRQSARGNPQTSPHWTSFASDFLWASRGGARGLRTECGDNSAGLRARSFLGLGSPIILMLYVTPSRFQKAPGGASRGWCFSHRELNQPDPEMSLGRIGGNFCASAVLLSCSLGKSPFALGPKGQLSRILSTSSCCCCSKWRLRLSRAGPARDKDGVPQGRT